MAPRRGTPSINTLSPNDAGQQSQGARSPGGSLSFPRSASPSNGFTSFFTKPTKWFNRSNSSGSIPGRASISSMEPRSSTSSGRRPKISHPTDPRPILDQLRPEPQSSLSNLSGAGSRSVLDLSLARTTMALEGSPSSPSIHNSSSLSRSIPSRGLGDLRNISRKPWSKSADDLGMRSHSTPALNPIDTSFHDKVRDYRNNRNDSVGSRETPTTHSPATSVSGVGYPFPTITTNADSPSSSPPHRNPIQPPSAGSSPINTINPPLTPGSQQNNGSVHARSYSFTPRLPSKLASPKVGLVPPSPRKKGSSAQDADYVKDKGASYSGSLGSGPAPRPTFPFSFGSSTRSVSPMSSEGVSPLDRPGVSGALLAPPAILEPDDSGDGSKRTSQLVYYSGFINRLSEFSPPALSSRANHSYMGGGGLSLAKGWKPFKLVLKGSKLYFYKPPSDRSATVKELFPTELVVVLEDEGIVEEEEGKVRGEKEEENGFRSVKGKEKEEGRRKRAFWGSATHPALVCGDGMERGTFEALVHEAVFSTTFAKSAGENDASQGGERKEASPLSQCKTTWRDFSSAVLFALPAAMDRAQFETEFYRCCDMLLASATEEDAKNAAQQKISWLAEQYLRHHEEPADKIVWEEWCSKTVPCFRFSQNVSGLPQSTSMQALYTPSPQLGETEKSPDLNAFSPRPHTNGRMTSLLDALGEPAVPRNGPDASQSWQSAIETTGLTRDILISLDPQLVARSLFVFNQRALQRIPNNISASTCMLSDSLSENAGSETTPSPLTPFAGDDERPHWLTKVVMLQILIADSPHPQSAQNPIFAQNMDGTVNGVLAARVHSRSDVVAAWANVAELCRRTGDECSWRAIFAALCSRPIARLDKVWKRVSIDALRAVQSWVYPVDNAVAAAVKEGSYVPWAGLYISQIKQALQAAVSANSGEWTVAHILQAWNAYEGLRTALSLCIQSSETIVNESADVEALVRRWSDLLVQGGGNIGVACKFKHIDQFMSLSLAAESRRKGMFEPFYWTRPAIQQGFHPLTPLLFPELLPTVTFINRALIHRGRLESTASSLNIQDLQHLREIKPPPTEKSPQDKADPLDLGGTVIIVYDGELMLLVQPGEISSSQPASRAPSRPPSSIVEPPPSEKPPARNPSIRVKPGSKGLDRKPSQLRRSSLPALSKKPSFEVADFTSERPLRVVIQAGTLDRLVDILVEGLHGVSVSVADDNGEMPLNDKKTRELKVDVAEFSRVWWATFRSFVTPHVFFELLRKRYLAAQIKSQSPVPGEVAGVVRARSEALETISRWIHDGNGAQDALDDPQLYASMMSFFRHPTDHSPPLVSPDDAPSIQHGFALISENLQAVFASFNTQTQRPITRTALFVEIAADGSLSTPAFGSQPPDIDQVDPANLVDNLDAMVMAAFRNVTQEDLFVTADILEVQTADRLGWFPAREPNAISDEVEIQSIHTYMHDIEPSSMIADLSQDSLYRLLPPAVRGCIRAFVVLRKWLISKLVAFKIGLRARQARMDLLLRAIEVCRLRSVESSTKGTASLDRPCVRSFVEALLSSAVVSIESRMYHKAWQTVAVVRNTSCDTLVSILGKSSTKTSVSVEGLTVDIGWLLERLVEVISLPDLLESSVQEGTALVNFEKRRSLYGLLTNSPALGLRRKARPRGGNDRKAFERLSSIEQKVSTIELDLRVIREDAYREASQAVASLTRKQPRPFQALVSAQQEKNKRDRTLRERLSREKRQEQQRQDRREEYLNKAMHARRPSLPAQKSHRAKKSMSSAFMQFMRPISSAFSMDLPLPTVRKTPAELDFVPSGKPAMVLNVADAKVSQFINNERSFTFQIDTEDGGHYLLQAMDKSDMKKWIETVDRVSKTAAKRRLTYLGHNSKLQMSEHLATPEAASRDPRAVFGVDLDFILQREATNGEVASGTLPSVFLRLVTEVEARGLTEIGIYRLAGAYSEVNSLKDALNRGEWPIQPHTDINAVCDLIKSWFRVLPGGMFPAPLHVNLMDAAAQGDVDLDARISNIRRIIHELPRSRFDLLKRLVEHLDKVTDYEESNQMTAESLATVFSPNLLRSADDDVGFFFANMSAAHRATKILITHGHTIFSDIEPDLDVDQEEEEYDQFDEPIPEEDEEDDGLLSPDNLTIQEEDELPDSLVAIVPEPPVLDFSLPSPCDLSIPMPS